MSGLFNKVQQAQDTAQQTAKQGEHIIQDCVNKSKEAGQKVIDQGCQAAQSTCDQVAGQVKDKLPSGWMK